MIIIPAILTSDISEFTSLIVKAEAATDRVQIDVIDGKFANNATVDPQLLKNISTFLKFDFHLMVVEPVDYINHCLISPENKIIGQIEIMKSQTDFVQNVKSLGALPGLGVDLDTPIEKLDKSVLSEIDTLLLMSVKAGWAGQEFDLSTFDKIKEAADLRNQINGKFKICVDGGVTRQLVNQMASLGVDEVYVGKRIFEPDLKKNLEDFGQD